MAKPEVSGLPPAQEQGAQTRRDLNPAGFLNVFQWRWEEKPETKGNIQMSLNISKKEVDRAFAGKVPNEKNGETYADIGVILSQAERCNPRFDKNKQLLKVDVTSIFRKLIGVLKSDVEGDLDADEVGSVIDWALTQLKAGHNPKHEMAELKAMVKHSSAVHTVASPAAASAEGTEESA